MKVVRLFLFYLVQFTWGLLGNIAGFVLFLCQGKLKREWYHGALVSYHTGNWGGVSMGIFVFVNGNRDEEYIRGTRVHEYGHTVQNMLLGPLYLLVIGLPSIVWCNSNRYIALRKDKGVSYFDFYPEKYANVLGSKVTHEAPPSR